MHIDSFIFRDRKDAGIQLAEALLKLGIKTDMVLAIPRGGVPLGVIVAEELGIPLKLYLVRKIGHPSNDEYAIGAVTENHLLLNQSENPDSIFLTASIQKERERIREMKEKFGHVATPNDIIGKKIILVDDGIATGTCILLAIQEIRKSGAKEIIVASPVCPLKTEDKIRHIADRLIILKHPGQFTGIGAYFSDFSQLTDNQVIALIKKSPKKVTQ
jgi:predicted phosphoribosyltransferase